MFVLTHICIINHGNLSEILWREEKKNTFHFTSEEIKSIYYSSEQLLKLGCINAERCWGKWNKKNHEETTLNMKCVRIWIFYLLNEILKLKNIEMENFPGQHLPLLSGFVKLITFTHHYLHLGGSLITKFDPFV